MLPGFAQTKNLGDGLTFEGAGASFIGSGQTTTLNCAGGGAHILGSNNTLTLTGACKWLDMVGSNNIVIVAFGNSANIEFAGSNNSITWTSADGKEPVVRRLGRSGYWKCRTASMIFRALYGFGTNRLPGGISSFLGAL